MMKYDTVLFDLDGTLTDSAPGIINSFAYALKHYGIRLEDRLERNCLIGPPIYDTFNKYFSIPEEETGRAVELYREYYRDIGIYENIVYEGIPQLLHNLKKSNKEVILATSKPTLFAEKILKHFNLERYFDFIAGSNLDGTRGKKSEVIQFALDHRLGMEEHQIVMVGDRQHDINGARECRIKSIGVLYGYGDRIELEEAGADDIARTVGDLEKLLLQ